MGVECAYTLREIFRLWFCPWCVVFMLEDAMQKTRSCKVEGNFIRVRATILSTYEHHSNESTVKESQKNS